MNVRPATPGDAAAIAAIHAQGIAERQATFDTEPPSAAEIAERIRAGRGPLLVAELGGAVVGWAGVVPYSDRAAYAGVAEASVYVDREVRAGGVGARLVEELAAAAEQSGLYKLVGKLFTTNAAAIALVEGCGFRRVGVHHNHGRIDGAWRDVVVVERLLGDAARAAGTLEP